MVNLSSIAAILGRCSQICTPGILVLMGLNDPRIRSGWSGFISQVSMWLGPPVIQSRMTLLLLLMGLPAFAASARACSRLGTVSPAMPARPAFSMLRRLTTCSPSRSRALKCVKACSVWWSERLQGIESFLLTPIR